MDTGDLTFLVLVFGGMILIGLVAIVGGFLHSRRERLLTHQERMKALEQGLQPALYDSRSIAAGRTAFLVPMVVFITAGTVTCFLTAYHDEHLFQVTIAVWAVAAIVSLAAITGGVALMGRLAQLDEGESDEEVPKNPLQD